MFDRSGMIRVSVFVNNRTKAKKTPVSPKNRGYSLEMLAAETGFLAPRASRIKQAGLIPIDSIALIWLSHPTPPVLRFLEVARLDRRIGN